MSDESTTRDTISVVIPTFNRPDEVLDAVRSALSQTRRPDEVIVVDDGSKFPPNAEALASLGAEVKLILNPTNSGGGTARNMGIDAATGRWLALLDSDDNWLPEKLERQMNEIWKRCDSSKVVVATNVLMRTAGRSDRPYNQAPRPAGRALADWFLIDNGTYQTSGLLMRTDFARAIRFNPKLRRHQDWDFLIRLEAAGATISYIHDCLVVYECRSDQPRVSQGNVKPTLAWFKSAGKHLSPLAKFTFYRRFWFDQHFEQKPIAALFTVASLTWRSREALRDLCGAAGRRWRRLSAARV